MAATAICWPPKTPNTSNSTVWFIDGANRWIGAYARGFSSRARRTAPSSATAGRKTPTGDLAFLEKAALPI
jgi:hypothetical protein